MTLEEFAKRILEIARDSKLEGEWIVQKEIKMAIEGHLYDIESISYDPTCGYFVIHEA